ncbi:MAG: FIST C-terminal domain-containing protein [Oligoflexia bacterium]|nr:FIST C-terminal domain-containing protein [Oligoflexia bacterium]
MKIGIGFGTKKNSLQLAKEVCEMALKESNIARPSIVFAFCNDKVDFDGYFNCLKEIFGSNLPIVGGSSVGIITNTFLSYNEYTAGIVVVESDSIEFVVASANNIDQNEKVAGETLAKKLSLGINNRSKLFMMFYDSIKIPAMPNSPPIMNASPPLIAGIESALSQMLPIIGAGLMGDMYFSPTRQFCGDSVSQQSVVGVVISGDFTPYFSIMHGCTPLDGIYHRITKMDGAVIYELDNKPIVGMIDRIYQNSNWKNEHPVRLLTMGVNCGDKYAPWEEEKYVNRLISGVLPDESGVIIFEPDLTEGTEVQFMLRDSRAMIRSAKENSRALVERIVAAGKKPFFGLYIDCAGRASMISDTPSEEAAEVQQICNSYGIPLFGIYSGVEVAPLLGKSRGLDWTGVLLIFAGDK